MSQQPVLGYASGSVQILREVDRVQIILPPPTRAAYWAYFWGSVLGASMLVLCACIPSGVTQTRYGTVEGPEGFWGHVVCVALAIGLLWQLWYETPAFRMPTRLTVSDGTLVCEIPSGNRYRASTYHLDAFTRAKVKVDEGTELLMLSAVRHRDDVCVMSSTHRESRHLYEAARLLNETVWPTPEDSDWPDIELGADELPDALVRIEV